MTENDISSTEGLEEAVYSVAAIKWVRYLGYIQVFVGFITIISGTLLLLIATYNGLIGVLNLRDFFGIFFVNFAPLIFLGVILVNVGYGVLDLETWSFPWVIYGNILTSLVYVLIGGPNVLFALGNLLALLILFTPWVREYWWTLFLEDMRPRIKEIKYSLHLIRKSPLVIVGIIIIAIYLAIAIFAPFLVHYGTSPYFIPRFYDYILRPPNERFWFGTDYLGSDVYSSVIWGAQIDLKIAISVVAVALIIGTMMGAIAGYRGGWVDEVVMRVTDVFFAFPGLILAMAVVAALGGRSLDNVSIALMFVWWPTYARLIRGQVLTEREKLYVEAARSVGASDTRILIFHILPNTIQPVIVQATLDMGAVLLTAAGLSFIGYGAEPGTAEWGLMIAVGRDHFTLWWVTFFPGMAILFCALAFNLVGDGIRDIMDPKLRRRT